MAKRSLFLLISVLLSFALPLDSRGGTRGFQAEWDSKYYNPSSLQDDLMLPLPGGGAMAFRPVIVVQDRITDATQFVLGNGKYPPKEYPREGSIGGVFKLEKNKMVFYMGKYEVTESQYDSVMNESGPANFSTNPKVNVSWFDAVHFADRWTRWLLKNHRDLLPADENEPGYVRLPTEEEWEFACRGGELVDANFFARDNFIPDTGNPDDYIQYYKVGDIETPQPLGTSRKPNPLGLYDMIGNVGEMCFNVFRLNYNYGRFGGFVVKGGNLRIPKPEQMRSSFRIEVPFYDVEKATASQNSLTGFRVVLTAPLITSLQRDALVKSEWDQNGIPSRTKLKETYEQAQQNISYLDQRVSDQDLKAGLGNVKDSLDSMTRDWNELEFRDALSFLRIGSFCGDTVRLQLERAEILKDVLQEMQGDEDTDPEALRNAQANFNNMLANIDKNLNAYGDAVESLNEKYRNTPDSFGKAYDEIIKKQELQGDADRIPTTVKMREHIEKFIQRDPEGWKRDLTELNS